MAHFFSTLGRVAIVALMLSAGARADVLDRLLAVVDTRIITLSDTRAALLFGFVEPPATGDRVYAAMQYLIDRALMLTEVQRYVPAEPPSAQVQARLDVIRSRFPQPDGLARALDITGLSEAQLAEMARDDLRIQTYIDDRFPGLQPSDRQARVADWVAGLRRRADVIELHLPQPR